MYDKKIERYTQKAEILKNRIKEYTEQLEKINAEIIQLRYASLCEATECNEKNAEEVLSREHRQIQKLKNLGLSDEEIDKIAENYTKNRKVQEDTIDGQMEIF